MRTTFSPLLAALLCLCITTFASARTIAIPLDDPLKDRVAEVVTLFGAPPTSETTPRLIFMPTAVFYGHQCFPAATGRNALRLGGPVDPEIFGDRLAIECVGLHQDAVNIAFALSRASHLEFTGPNTLTMIRGGDEVMTLRLLN